MKTPKRAYVSLGGDTDDVITARKAKKCARWKRKNKIAQLKRTIARLKKEKEAAYHKGHKAGYDLCFARRMF